MRRTAPPSGRSWAIAWPAGWATGRATSHGRSARKTRRPRPHLQGSGSTPPAATPAPSVTFRPTFLRRARVRGLGKPQHQLSSVKKDREFTTLPAWSEAWRSSDGGSQQSSSARCWAGGRESLANACRPRTTAHPTLYGSTHPISLAAEALNWTPDPPSCSQRRDGVLKDQLRLTCILRPRGPRRPPQARRVRPHSPARRPNPRQPPLSPSAPCARPLRRTRSLAERHSDQHNSISAS